MSRFGVAIFSTTSSVMQAEKALLMAGVEIKLIPTPREFSSDCGISVRFDWTAADNVRNILGDLGIKFDTICLMARKAK